MNLAENTQIIFENLMIASIVLLNMLIASLVATSVIIIK